MRSVIALILLLAIFLFSCGKKESNVSDVKKETPKTETTPSTQSTTPSTTSSEVKLPADFPLKDDVFKKAAVHSVANSSGLITVGFEAGVLPDNIVTIIDKELSKDGYKKGDEEKFDKLNMTQITWSKDQKKIQLQTYTSKSTAIVYESEQK